MKRTAKRTLCCWCSAFLLATLCLLGTFLVSRTPRSPSAPGARGEPDPAAARHLPRIAWPQGRRQVYRLTYRDRADASPLADDAGAGAAASAPISSRLVLEATVAVTGEDIGSAGSPSRVTFEVLSCERGSWEIAGGVAWANAAACSEMLEGASLGAEVTPIGITSALYDAPEAASSAQSVLQALWLRLQFALPETALAQGESYRAEEAGLQGTAVGVYSLRAANAAPQDGYILERSVRGYRNARAAEGLRRPRVEAGGSAVLALDGRGLLRGLHGDERIRVSTAGGASVLTEETSFRFEWLREEGAPQRREVSGHGRRAPTSALTGAGIEEKLRENQIAGLDLETLLETIRTYGNGGQLPDEARFFWRASGLLEKDPEAAWELLPLYRHPAARAELRGKVLDLLASVGHEVAQAVMREALGDPEELAEGGVAVRHLYQRLGLVRRPAPETAEMVATHYREFRDSGRLEAEMTAAYALGAIVGKLSQGDDEARTLAELYNAELAGDLYRAADAAQLAHRVTALANARRPDNVPVFSRLAGHPSTRVRQRVARALGKSGSETPPVALLELMGDEDRHVQRSAIRVAAPHDEVYGQIAEQVAAGELPQFNVRPILDLIKKGRNSHRPSTARLLDALIARGIEDDKDREVALLLRRM